MGFATLNFQSPALSKACSMTVIVPERTLAYPWPADKYFGPLVSRLSSVNQPALLLDSGVLCSNVVRGW